MASPDNNNNNQDQPKKQPGQSSDSTDHPPPPAPTPTHSRQQSHETSYPPAAMGYPPNMGYLPHGQPGYPPPQYHNYPNAYNGYPYTQPPPAAYYSEQAYPSRGSGFARGIMSALIFLVIFTFLSTLLTWFILRPEMPVFHVNTLSVANYNVSGPIFTADWDANMTVDNPNTKLKVYFERIESLMYYKENILATALVEPFFMETEAKEVRNVKLKANSTEQPMVGSWVVKDMGEERGGGAVSFDLKMVVWTTFKSGTWWTRTGTLRISCERLKVAFVGATGNGATAPGIVKDCLVYA